MTNDEAVTYIEYLLNTRGEPDNQILNLLKQYNLIATRVPVTYKWTVRQND